MLRRFLIASAAAMLLVTTFHSDDAVARGRGGGGMHGGGHRGGGMHEIPSGRESNDNIGTFWRIAQPLAPGRPAHFAYRIVWSAERALPKSLGKVIATRSGASVEGKRRVFLLDFIGAGEKVDGLRLDLSTSAGRISNATVMTNSALHGLRASFEMDPRDASLIELRLRIMRGDHPVTETWLYRWTPS